MSSATATHSTQAPSEGGVAWSRLSQYLLPNDIDSLDNRNVELIEDLSEFFGTLAHRYFSFQQRGFDRIPEGAGLYVGNHNGGILSPDTFLFSTQVFQERGIADIPYALTHEAILQLPLFHHIGTSIGCIRANHANAAKAFQAGHKVLVYPGGDEDVFRPYRRRNEVVFGGRRGYIRLALRHNIPIIPVVTAGAHETFLVLEDFKWLAKILKTHKVMRTKVWPLVLSLPWGLTLGITPPHLPLPSPVHMEVVEPFYFARSGEAAARDDAYVDKCAAMVEEVMQDTLTKLAQERKEASSFIWN